MTAMVHAMVHATCVAIGACGVLLRGPSGAGKSDLALRLIDAGAALVADDQVRLTLTPEGVVAACPPALAGLIEVRGYGPASLAYRPRAVIGLVVDLRPFAEIERVPDQATVDLCGQAVRAAQVDPAQPGAAARVRLLATTGVRISSLADRRCPTAIEAPA